jgi:two-component system, chemotaxis family, chemotaxis protein CheY
MSNRILAVDDSASMRQMVAFTLKSAGFDVAEAEDGQAALDLAKTEKFKLVLADVNMPRMDGITLVKNLRTLAEYKFTPLLMLTTESTPEKKMEGKAAGATGWLVKPFNPEQLVATVQRVLG